jgi:hypothetical protein
MEKAIVFLGSCILVAALVLGGVWVYTSCVKSEIELKVNRYYFGVNSAGQIKSEKRAALLA